MHTISNPLSPGERGLRVVARPHVGHERRIVPVFNYRITDLEAQIKTKQKSKTVNTAPQIYTLQAYKDFFHRKPAEGVIRPENSIIKQKI